MVGAAVAAMLSFTGCLENPGEPSLADPAAETVTLDKAHIVQDGDSMLITGMSDGVESSVRASQVTVGGKSFAGDDETSNIVQCYLCSCHDGVCVCVPVGC